MTGLLQEMSLPKRLRTPFREPARHETTSLNETLVFFRYVLL